MFPPFFPFLFSFRAAAGGLSPTGISTDSRSRGCGLPPFFFSPPAVRRRSLPPLRRANYAPTDKKTPFFFFSPFSGAGETGDHHFFETGKDGPGPQQAHQRFFFLFLLRWAPVHRRFSFFFPRMLAPSVQAENFVFPFFLPPLLTVRARHSPRQRRRVVAELLMAVMTPPFFFFFFFKRRRCSWAAIFFLALSLFFPLLAGLSMIVFRKITPNFFFFPLLS